MPLWSLRGAHYTDQGGWPDWLSRQAKVLKGGISRMSRRMKEDGWGQKR